MNSTSEAAGKSILWIEDEVYVQKIKSLSKHLLLAGHEMDNAYNVSEAIEKMKKENYDAVIINLLVQKGNDYNLKTNFPDMDLYGLDLIDSISEGKIEDIEFDPSKMMVFTEYTDITVRNHVESLGIKYLKMGLVTPGKFKKHVEALF